MASRSLKEDALTVGQIIREYRKARGMTQKQFAGELGVEARTLRMYENGERELENISDLRRIAELLAIDPAELGLAARTIIISSAEQIDAAVEQVAALVQQARLVEARTSIETLLRDLKKQGEPDDPQMLRALAVAHCMAGQVQALTSRTRDVARIIPHYREMARIAQELEEQTLLALALAYHGDLLRRRGDGVQALGYLERARASCPATNPAACGTIALLFGRTYLARQETDHFEAELASAVEFAKTCEASSDGVLTQGSLGEVYAEYARGYALLGRLEQSQRYTRLTEDHGLTSTLWSVQLKAIQAEALVHAGDIMSAMPLLLEVAHLAQMYGHQLLVERLYRLRSYLEDQISLFRQASRSLSDVLQGPIEH